MSPQRLLRQGTSHLAGIARQGDGEGVLALSQTQRSALLAPALEIAAKRAVESRRIETRHPRHQPGPRQCAQAGQLDPPEMLGPLVSSVIRRPLSTAGQTHVFWHARNVAAYFETSAPVTKGSGEASTCPPVSCKSLLKQEL